MGGAVVIQIQRGNASFGSAMAFAGHCEEYIIFCFFRRRLFLCSFAVLIFTGFSRNSGPASHYDVIIRISVQIFFPGEGENDGAVGILTGIHCQRINRCCSIAFIDRDADLSHTGIFPGSGVCAQHMSAAIVPFHVGSAVIVQVQGGNASFRSAVAFAGQGQIDIIFFRSFLGLFRSWFLFFHRFSRGAGIIDRGGNLRFGGGQI